MTNYSVDVKSFDKETNMFGITGYVIKDATSTDDAATRACRAWRFGGNSGEIVEVTVKKF